MPPDWPALITTARGEVPSPLVARRYDGAPGVGVSQTQYFTCTDGNTYVVKFKGNADGSRALATEQVVAHLGLYLGAPIPPAAHVQIGPELLVGIQINGQPALAGVHHGSRLEPDCTDRAGLQYADQTPNRERFAALQVLYTWVGADDANWIYKKLAPNLVFSIDHARFLPGGTGWTAATLVASGAPRLDPSLQPLALDLSVLGPPLARLEAVRPGTIAAAVARVHTEWGVDDTDVAALAAFLHGRMDQTVQLFRSGRR